MTDALLTAPEFLITKEYRRFAEFCDACRQYRYIGVCHGSPGVGKTLSARHYAHWNLLEPILHDHFEKIDQPVELATWRTMFYAPTVLATPKRLEREITSLCLLLSVRIQEQLDPKWDYTLPKPAHTELLLNR